MCCPRNKEDDDNISDDRISEQLVSKDRVRIGSGISLVHGKYRHEMADRLRNRFRWLQSDEIGQVWNRTLEQLAGRALAGGFKAEGSLSGLVWTIAFRRAIDLRRRQWRSRRQEQLDEDAHVGFLAMENEDLPLEELLRAIREAISELPDRQRQVWEAFADSGFKLQKKELLEKSSKLAGESLTWKAVCRALQEGRKKVIEYLRRRGYHW